MSRDNNLGRFNLGRFGTGRTPVGAQAPSVDSLSVTEVSFSNTDVHIDVTWAVSDPDDDLDYVEFEVYDETDNEKEPQNQEKFDVAGGSADNGSSPYRFVVFNEEGSGHTYSVTITVVDKTGKTDTQTASFVESSTNPPSIDQLSITEVETNNSDAEFDVYFEVSDAGDNLSTLDLTLRDTTDGVDDDTASPSVSGGSASDTIRMVAAGDDGSGHSFEVTATVTDGNGDTATATASTTESEVSPIIQSQIDLSTARSNYKSADYTNTPHPIGTKVRAQLFSLVERVKVGSNDSDDIEVNGLGDVTFDSTADPDTDKLYALWLTLKSYLDTNYIGAGIAWEHIPHTDGDYLLSNREQNANGPKEVRMNRNGSKEGAIKLSQSAFWVDVDMAGLTNPYYDNDNLRRKLGAEAAQQMLLHNWQAKNTIARDLSVNYMNTWLSPWRDCIRAFRFCASALQDETKFAFVEAAAEVWEEMTYVNYTWVNQNMSSFGIGGATTLWRFAKDLGMNTIANEIKANLKEIIYSERNDAHLSNTPNQDTYARTFERERTNSQYSYDDGWVRPDGHTIENGGSFTAYEGNPQHFFGESLLYVQNFPGELGFVEEFFKNFGNWWMRQILTDATTISGYGEVIAAPSQYGNREYMALDRAESPSASKFALLARLLDEWKPYLGQGRTDKTQGVYDPTPATKSTMKNELETMLSNIDFTSGAVDTVIWHDRVNGIGYDEGLWGHRNAGPTLWDLQARGDLNGIVSDFNNLSSNNDDRLKLPVERGDYANQQGDHGQVRKTYSGREWGAHFCIDKVQGRFEINFPGIQSFWTKSTGPIVCTERPSYTILTKATDKIRPFTRFTVIDNNTSVDFQNKGFGTGEAQPRDYWNRSTNQQGNQILESHIKRGDYMGKCRFEVFERGLNMSLRVNPDVEKTMNTLRLRLPIFRGVQRKRNDVNTGNLYPWDGFLTRVEYYDGTSWNTFRDSYHPGEPSDPYITGVQTLRLSRDVRGSRSYVWMQWNSPVGVRWWQEDDYTQGENDGRYPSQAKWFWDLDFDLFNDTPRTTSNEVGNNFTLQVVDPT